MENLKKHGFLRIFLFLEKKTFRLHHHKYTYIIFSTSEELEHLAPGLQITSETFESPPAPSPRRDFYLQNAEPNFGTKPVC